MPKEFKEFKKLKSVELNLNKPHELFSIKEQEFWIQIPISNNCAFLYKQKKLLSSETYGTVTIRCEMVLTDFGRK